MVASLQEAQQIIALYERTLATQAEQIATLERQVESVTTLQRQLQVLQESLKTAQATIQKQQYQLELYARRLYGRTSEHYHPDQLRFDSLLLEAVRPMAADAAAAPAAAPYAARSAAHPRPPRARHH